MDFRSPTGKEEIAPAPKAAPSRGRLTYIHLFRGFTIFQIVLLHAGRVYFLRGFEEQLSTSNLLFITIDVFFHDATLYFTFISGVLYAWTFSRHPMPIYYKNRIQYVIIPYVVLTIIFTSMAFLFLKMPPTDGNSSFTGRLVHNILTGDAQYTYWYVPVIILLYLVSPVYAALLSSKARLPLIAAACILPLFFSRTGTHFTVMTLIYFSSAYILGMVMGEKPDHYLAQIARRVVPISIVAVASTIVLFYLFVADADMVGFTSLRESAFFVQKCALGALILLVFQRGIDRLPGFVVPVLGLFASTAYSLYLLHGFAFRRIVHLTGRIFPDPTSNWGLFGGMIFTFVLGLGACWLVIFTTKRVLGANARFIIGK